MAGWRIPGDDEIGALLAERIDTERQGVGVVVGVVDEGGARVIAHGRRAAEDAAPPDGDTAFEIGSITKVFTALLLADMALSGEAGLEAPASELAPPTVRMPEREREIRLIDLARHRSGLPRWPDDMAPALGAAVDWTNPYAAYSEDQLRAFLNRHELARAPGAAHAYSNLGYGLLGALLARKAGCDFETLVRTRAAAPLGMTRTGTRAAVDATPHDPRQRPVAAWEMPTFAGAGALRSTADDMLRFLAAQAGLVEPSLRQAMREQRAHRTPSDGAYAQALGWRVERIGDQEIVWHGGATAGSRAFALFAPDRRAGVVMLSNCAGTRNDDLPFHILAGRPLTPPAPQRETIVLAPEALDRHVGLYRFGPGRQMLVTRNGARLFAQMTGQWRLEVLAESETRFVWIDAAAEMTFAPGASGDSWSLVLRQNGREYRAGRVAPAPIDRPVDRA